MAIELLYFDGCPNYEAFLPRLRALLDEAGVRDELELRAIETAEAAEAERFLGSPTLRIDGVDVDTGAAERTGYGLECRLSRTAYGFSATPPGERVLEALRRRHS